ncbi:MAG TPA: FAD-binding domain-containing protein, partial [Candidatus Caenarcaniphilales bacterium]
MKADLSRTMRRNFASRDELVAYVREQFSTTASRDPAISSTLGGRQAAQTALNKVEPATYAQTRNSLKGAVTRLSPYLRYGVLSLAEVRDAVLLKVSRPSEVKKLINELAWRDYWQRLYAKLGDHVWQDQEPYKTGFTPNDYAEVLPPDIEAGATGRVCIDHFSQELHQTGYLHNHARLWLAAYLVHWRHIRWQTGSRWFLMHL